MPVKMHGEPNHPLYAHRSSGSDRSSAGGNGTLQDAPPPSPPSSSNNSKEGQAAVKERLEKRQKLRQRRRRRREVVIPEGTIIHVPTPTVCLSASTLTGNLQLYPDPTQSPIPPSPPPPAPAPPIINYDDDGCGWYYDKDCHSSVNEKTAPPTSSDSSSSSSSSGSLAPPPPSHRRRRRSKQTIIDTDDETNKESNQKSKSKNTSRDHKNSVNFATPLVTDTDSRNNLVVNQDLSLWGSKSIVRIRPHDEYLRSLTTTMSICSSLWQCWGSDIPRAISRSFTSGTETDDEEDDEEGPLVDEVVVAVEVCGMA